ncbi:hypothetical protein APHAL10511_002687 [Amanita phalloides]|nr:hypothetical protein APHAL10511_002687 [Amanita phalloides]
MVKSLQVLVDDQDPDIEYLCDVSTKLFPNIYYNDTWTTVASLACSYEGWFRYSFIGTGVQLGLPVTSDSAQVSVQIDNHPYEPLKGSNRYVSPNLKDGPHNVTFSASGANAQPGLDYLTFTAGASTPLEGQIIIHSDDDKVLHYDGDWSTQQPESIEFDDTLLYQGTAHWSTTVGDSVSYSYFFGTSVTVMGISTPSEMNASLAFTVDGDTTMKTISQTNLDKATTVRLFSMTGLQPGRHSLGIKVMNISVRGPIGINFLAYSASYSRLSDVSGPYDGSVVIPREKTQSIILTGAIIGGITLVVGLVICFFAWRRERNRQFPHKFNMMETDLKDLS